MFQVLMLALTMTMNDQAPEVLTTAHDGMYELAIAALSDAGRDPEDYFILLLLVPRPDEECLTLFLDPQFPDPECPLPSYRIFTCSMSQSSLEWILYKSASGAKERVRRMLWNAVRSGQISLEPLLEGDDPEWAAYWRCAREQLDDDLFRFDPANWSLERVGETRGSYGISGRYEPRSCEALIPPKSLHFSGVRIGGAVPKPTSVGEDGCLKLNGHEEPNPDDDQR